VDDEWLPHHLETATNIMLMHKDLKWYGAAVNQYFDRTNKMIKRYKEKKPGILVDNAYFEDYMLAFPPFAHFATPTMIISKEVFHDVGTFDPSMKSGEDLDMWFRIGLRFPKVGYSHRVSAKVYKRHNSITYTKQLSYTNSINNLKKKEQLAEQLGSEVLIRVEPRIIIWLVRILRANISANNIKAVCDIKDNYTLRLPLKWKIITSIYLLYPNLISSFIMLLKYSKIKKCAIKLNGLTKEDKSVYEK
jgi:hypothetical protein